MRPLVAERQPARLQHVARQEKAGQREAVELAIEAGMRIALGQQPHQRGQMADAIDRVRRREEVRRAQARALHRIIAEMLVEPRPPGRAHGIADLQYRFHARAETAAHQPEMAAMRARHQLEDAAGLPVALDAEHDAFIGPLHLITVIPERSRSERIRNPETYTKLASGFRVRAFARPGMTEPYSLGNSSPMAR